MYRSLLKSLILFFFVFKLSADERPNILVIVVDDLGYVDVGFMGSTEVSTPVLDQLASNGVIFHSGYVTHPYCGPSRAGLITGRYQARFGVETNFTYSPYDLHQGLPLEEKTFAERLKPAGYRTGIIGKWHLGASKPFHPNSRGFDHFYGFLSGGHYYWPESVTNVKDLILPNGNPHYSFNEGSFLPLSRNDQIGEFDEYLTTALSRDAADFIRESDTPFLLYLAYNAPHGPLEAPADLIEKYSHIEPATRRTYLAMIDSLDQGIGMVVDALEETGKLENTLIFFLSDNGGVAPKVNHMNENWADNGPLREGKGSMYEGGSRVPFIAHWPKGIPGGQDFDYPVSSLDIAATTVALGEGDTSGHPLDGVNLIPHLDGTLDHPPHEAIYWRVRDGAGWAIRTPTAKMLKKGYSTDPPELFDMVNDPYESANIIDQNPELRQQLAKLWNDWNAGNSANVFLQAGEYQRMRLQLYRELYEEQKAKADARDPIVIK
ncbi:MAG: sulfatase-like hydrolase/transferase [Verrucomicrobiota bacterium]